MARTEGWPRPARATERVTLRFAGATGRKTLRNLSAATRLDDTLFLAADEGAAIERLVPDKAEWAANACFELDALLTLGAPGEEADIEGLAIETDASGPWLWIVGSHARTRAKPQDAEDECIDLAKLAELKDTRARCLLARVPLRRTEAGWAPIRRDGARRAGLIKQGRNGGAIGRLLREDALLGPFTRVPAKEGGVDVEGIAVCGTRVALGMRGPVIAGHALLLEMRVTADKAGKLRLAGEPVKRLLALDGLGIRDLKRVGRDLLILAGPTTGLSGPVALYRWQAWADDPPQDAKKVRLHRPARLLDLPFGRGVDHPEGLARWDRDDRVLIVCDSPSQERADGEQGTIAAEVFALKG